MAISIRGAIVLSALLSACDQPLQPTAEAQGNVTETQIETNSQIKPGDVSTVAQEQLQSEIIYEKKCSACHGPVDKSTKRNRGRDDILGAISSQPAMASILLTDFELDAIVAALSDVKPTLEANSTPAPLVLYDKFCSNCHGPLATSAKKGANLIRLDYALLHIPEMASLKNITAAEKAEILASLSEPAPAATSTPASTNTPASTSAALSGASLYQSDCASCHGPIASSTKRGANSARLNFALQNIPEMGGLTNLTADERTAILAALALPAATPTPTAAPTSTSQPTTTPAPASTPTAADYLAEFDEGKALYDSKCGICHGALATSSKRNVTAAAITNALTNIAVMGGVSVTSTQVTSIQFALRHQRSEFDNSAPVTTPTYRTSYSRQVPLQNREALTNRFKYIFATDASQNVSSTIMTIISSNITTQPFAMGGLCFQGIDTGCPGATAYNSGTIVFQNAEAAMLPQTSAPRAGYLTKTCSSLIENNAAALQNALAKGTLLTSDTVTSARIETMWGIFFPNIDANSDVLASLYASAQQSAIANISTIEIWRDVLIAFCQSSLMERY